MPRGKYVNHKGRGRSFTSAEELAREQREMKNKKKLKDEGEEDSDEEEEEGEGGGGSNANAVDKTKKKDQEESSSSEEESDEEEDENRKLKGVEGLLVGQIENPNRRVVKPQKLKNLTLDSSGDGSGSSASASASKGDSSEAKPELSRREREAIEKQKAKERYQKLHAEGKTDEAQKDLARLAIIRKQREEAAAKRLAEQTEKLALKQTKQAETSKALGKK